jgi:hypothetical protein
VLTEVPDNPAGAPSHTIDPDMLLFSQHLASAIMSPEWREAIRRAEQDYPAVVALLKELAVRDLPVPHVAFELDETSSRAALAWPERKVAVLSSAEPAGLWTAAGWDARPASAWTAEALARRITA